MRSVRSRQGMRNGRTPRKSIIQQLVFLFSRDPLTPKQLIPSLLPLHLSHRQKAPPGSPRRQDLSVAEMPAEVAETLAGSDTVPMMLRKESFKDSPAPPLRPPPPAPDPDVRRLLFFLLKPKMAWVPRLSLPFSSFLLAKCVTVSSFS